MSSGSALLNQQQKTELLRSYGIAYELRILVETGLWNGHGSGMPIARGFDRYVAVDAQQANWQRAKDAGFEAHFGSSAIVLPYLLGRRANMMREPAERLDRNPALFWLDAHYVVEGDDFLAANPSPLLAELRAILEWPHAPRSVVLVDDVRMLGAPGWPTRDEIAATLDTFGDNPWEAREVDDVLRLVPQR
jgi:hypothetical protein